MTSIIPQCATCRHFRRHTRAGSLCDAYPDGDGIPDAIITNEEDHRRPLPGDHGIQYAPRPGMWHPKETSKETETA